MIKTIHTNDQELLEGIQKSDARALEKIYREILPGIIRYIQKNRGSEDEARDIFQDAMIVLFRKLRAGDLELKCTLNTYLSSICRNLWLKKLRDHKEMGMIEGVDFIDPDEDTLHNMQITAKRKLFRKYLEGLGDKCRELLKMTLLKIPYKKIAEKLGTSEGYIKKRKFECNKKLVEAIKSDPAYHELKT
ncbi:MAG: sigma-70 family RNA polymerase sigma factor [Bacteroidetes bacterium]|nr:sigma-70 family RNA polymerase sigma factor [Bacteroidota bacterium]MCB0842813.1 sigma-70 family RNA polymerase sigma factor [Bacteroidota bacterium]MCB0854160.1 sigma-70 family RNA polymerase sigma factor [Bacteroidota bacterium]